MSTCTALLHELSSREFWPLCTENSASHVKKRSYLNDQRIYRCELQEMRRLTIFLKSLNFYYCKCMVPKFMNISVQWFQEMTVNTTI